MFDAGVTITFAHRPFAWKSEARGMAHVHVVIIGMAIGDTTGTQRLWDYPDPKGPGIESAASCIGPYLTDSAPIVVHRAGAPIVANVPKATYGATAGDKGHLLFTEDTVADALADPIAKKYLRLYIGADELLNGQRRWVLWLDGVPASEMRKSNLISDRVAKVKKFRSDSNRAGTKAAAATPWLLLEPRAPSSNYLFVPCVSSERRDYVPMELRGTDTIVRASSWFIEGADMFLFGMLHSAMFMAWVRMVGGRLESRLQVSAETVYNTFPFPDPTPAARQKVEKAAAKVIAARKKHPTSTLEDLYDPRFMPIDLRAAHNDLDKAADAAMNPRRRFRSDADRLAYLLDRYEAITSPLVTTPTPKRRRAAKP
ncbi:MAG TPA: DNA methyltransferase [Acidimicrobiaceae bacterium]|nr:DNA methyltransferase [Acidimicrobiaceae bacterium]